jgi:hypothetical protein
MNEKIKQLADQARALADQFQEQWKAGPSNEEFFQEKFAELIVRECADACYKHKDVESFGIYPVRVAMVTKACSNNIKEHFGVEE